MRPIVYIFCLFVLFSLLPASSAVIQKEEVDITVDAQNRVIRHVTRTVAIRTPAAYRSFGETFFVFNPKLQEIRIIRSTSRR